MMINKLEFDIQNAIQFGFWVWNCWRGSVGKSQQAFNVTINVRQTIDFRINAINYETREGHKVTRPL